MNFLNWFTGPKVRLAGFVLTGLAILLLPFPISIVYGLSLALALASTYKPSLFNWLSNFADPQFWPTFVALGIAILCAAHVGGLIGVLACLGPLTAYDGMYFEQNY